MGSKRFTVASSSVICSPAVPKEIDSLWLEERAGNDCIRSLIKYFIIYQWFIHSKISQVLVFTVLWTKGRILGSLWDFKREGVNHGHEGENGP